MHKFKPQTLILSLGMLFVMIASLSFPVQAELLAVSTPTKTPTRTPTRTPLFRATSTPTLSPFSDLYQQLSWGGLGGGGGSEFYLGDQEFACFDDEERIFYLDGAPKIESLYGTDSDVYFVLCLFNFPVDKQIKISFKSPDGKLYASAVFRKGKYYKGYDWSDYLYGDNYWIDQISPSLGDEPAGRMRVWNDLTVSQIILWKQINLPQGRWGVTVSAGNTTMKANINLGWPKEEMRADWVYLRPNMFERPSSIGRINTPCHSIKKGEKQLLQVVNLKPKESIGLFTYVLADRRFQYNFVHDSFITANTKGQVQAIFSSDREGFYIVVPILTDVENATYYYYAAESKISCIDVD